MNRKKLRRQVRRLAERISLLEKRLNLTHWTDVPPGVRVDMDPPPSITDAVAAAPLIVSTRDDDDARRGYL